MGERKQVLVADDEANLRRVLAAQLKRDGYEVDTVADGEAVIQALNESHIDVLITDLRMPKLDGMQVLEYVNAHHPNVPVIMITAHGTVDTAVQALKFGAFDYVTKPFDQTEFRNVVNKAARMLDLSKQHATDVAVEAGRFRIIGQSGQMRRVYDVIDKVAGTPSTVLITGESGTGKELIARALHENSPRAKRAFVRVNCAAIPPELIESELFGYERGAFTGAVTSKPGRFELADEGTLFLDEIGELSVAMQVKLLRALQEREFERVGGVRTLHVDTRLIAATNQELHSRIASGDFREDLYYRLNVVQINLPPLRERPTDIPLLVNHFIEHLNKRLQTSVTSVSPGTLDLLCKYHWRGNIRELENVVERAMIFCDEDTIQPMHLPDEVRNPERRALRQTKTGEHVSPASRRPSSTQQLHSVDGTSVDIGEASLKDMVREATARMECDLITRALERTEGNVTHAAKLLQISRKSLQTKMKDFGLRNDE